MTKIKVEINIARCKGCGFCVSVCHQKCLVTAKDLNAKGVRPAEFIEGAGECRGCMNCVLMCPDLAIEILEDENG